VTARIRRRRIETRKISVALISRTKAIEERSILL
jgi:hypothetical protein